MDKNIKRCEICGNWTYLADEDKLKILMGEQHACDICLPKMRKKPNVA